MTTLTAHAQTDMTGFDLATIDDGAVTSHTATKWEVVNPGFFLDFLFKGTGLTYPNGADPKPNGGTIHSLTVEANGNPAVDIVGDFSAKKLSHLIATHNTVGWEKAWFSSDDILNGSGENDHLLGYDGDDVFNLGKGGEDTAEGGDGNDTFNMGAELANDHLFGGAGSDTVVLKGHYQQMIGSPFHDIETVVLRAGFDYDLVMDGYVGDQPLVFDAGGLGSHDSANLYTDANKPVVIDGGAGDDALTGGKAADVLSGGDGRDFLVGRGGGDRLFGGQGPDVFSFNAVSESASKHFDTVIDFHAANDKFAFDFAVGSVGSAQGALSDGNFDSDLSDALGSAQLPKHGAVVFTADGGSRDGDVFLIVDGNNHAGYQAGKDFVIFLEDTSHLGGFDLTNFEQNA